MGSINIAITGDNSNAVRAFEGLRSTVRNTMGDVENAGASIDSMMSRITQAAAAVGVGLGLKEFGQSILSVRKNIESLEVSFTSMLGSQEKAASLMSEIREFAVNTPMQLGDLAQGAKTMLSFGIELEKIMPLLHQIGDVSQGDSQKFQSLVLSFSQATSAGRLMGGDFLQMINAGFNPLNIIAQKTGKTMRELKDDMSNGAISAEMLADAYKTATSEGGIYYNSLEDQSKSIKGALSNLQGAWDDMLNDMGTKMQDNFVTAVTGATDIVKSYEKYIGVLGGLVTAYGAYKAVLMAVTAIQSGKAVMENIQLMMMFRKELGLMTAAQQAFNITAMANPYVLLASAIAVVVGGLTAYYLTCDKTTEAQKAFNAAQEEYKNKVEEEKNEVQKLIDVMNDANRSDTERQKALKDLQSMENSYIGNVGKVFKAYKTYKEYIEDTTNALKRLNEEESKTSLAKTKGDYNDMKSQIAKLREYKKLSDEVSASSGRKKLDAQQKIAPVWASLSDDLKKQIQADGIDSVIADTIKHANGKAKELRQTLNAEWDATWLSGNVDSTKLKNELNYLQKQVNNGTAEYVLMGGVPISKKDLKERIEKGNEILSKSSKSVSKNYAYWEDIKKKAEAELKQLSSSDKGTKKWNDLVSQIKKAEAEMKKYSSSSSTQATNDAYNRAKQEAEYLALQKQYQKEEMRKKEDSLLASRQLEINLLEESGEKILKQINLNYDKEKVTIERWYDDLLATKIAKAKTLWEKDPNNAKKVWKDSYASVGYTDEEKNEYNARVEANEKTKNDAMRDYYEEEKQYMLDYLKEYGTIEEQRLAIVEDYEQKIKDAKYDYAKKALEEERDLALKEFDFSKFKDKINWEGIFGNLEYATKNQLDNLKAQLEAYMNTDAYKTLNPDQKKEVVGGLNNINSAYANSRGIFGAFSQSRKDIHAAETRVGDARASVDAARSNLDLAKSLGASAESLRKAEKELENAEKERDDAENDLTNKTIQSQQRLREAINKLGDNLQSLPELTSALGFDDNSSVGKVANGIADTANNAMGAYADFMSGNYVGALAKGISAIDSAVGIFDSGNTDKMEAEIERLTKANENLSKVIDDLRKSIDEGSVADATKKYEEAVELMKKMEENSSNAMIDKGSEWSHGGHSLNYEFNDRSGNRSAVEQAGKILGVNISTLQDFLSLSGKQMQDLRNADVELYNRIMEGIRGASNGHNADGLESMIEQYINDYAEVYEDMDSQLKNKLTNTSLDSIKSEFRSVLLDMDSSAEDFAENFETMMRNAVINAMVSNEFDKELGDWYKRFAKAMESDGLNSRELADLQKEYEVLSNNALAKRDALKNILGLEDSAEQSSSTRGVGSMSQDTAEELNGRFTALQISNEQININIASALSILSQISVMDSLRNTALSNILLQTTLVNTNLASLEKLHKSIKAEFSDVLARIETNTRKI